ncbi:alpha-ketoacid dehydrogenase subunit beta [Dehalococcoidia bacterium]|nr:alpha-ketoacid dehydrogenase subunit beta [Dehalococcoidia bacterium]
MTEITYREAMTRALREAMSEDEKIFILGEDIGEYGGAYAVTKGLLKEFGPRRIIESPISEATVLGTGTGAAMGGLHPIIEIMTINFALLAMDQIVNHAAKIRYMSGGQFEVPLIIRTVTGGGGQLGATHSQSLEGWFASVPGLKVVTPATPYDALGLFRSVREERDPVIFVEHILLYNSKGEVPDNRYAIPLGKADIKRPGDDFTIVTYSRMVSIAIAAAETLSSKGINVEVVDLRSLRPWDTDTVLKSVQRTGHVLVLEEAWRTGGFGAEVASTIQDLAFDYLDGPVTRIAGADVPAPYSRGLEQAAIPNSESVVQAVLTALGK